RVGDVIAVSQNPACHSAGQDERQPPAAEWVGQTIKVDGARAGNFGRATHGDRGQAVRPEARLTYPALHEGSVDLIERDVRDPHGPSPITRLTAAGRLCRPHTRDLANGRGNPSSGRDFFPAALRPAGGTFRLDGRATRSCHDDKSWV